MKVLELLFITMRPSRWWRAGVIALPLLFCGDVLNIVLILKILVAMIIFILLTGSINIIDDIVDIETDKKDLIKRTLPIASGDISVNKAEFGILMILIGAFVSAFFLGPYFGMVSVAYFFVCLSYFLFLKKHFILDSLAIGAETSLIIVAGTIAIAKPIASWLLVFAVLLSMLVVFCERKRVVLIGGLKEEKPVLPEGYDDKVIDQLINLTTPLVLVVYTLFSLIGPEGIKYNLFYTTPFVIYGVYRIFYLTYNVRSDKSLEKQILSDQPLWADIAIWVVLVAVLMRVF